jgi:hypothetical protein
MRKLKKSVNFDRWEKAAAKYAHSYSDQDGWEIERFGYKKLNLAVKLRLLKVNSCVMPVMISMDIPNTVYVFFLNCRIYLKLSLMVISNSKMK